MTPEAQKIAIAEALDSVAFERHPIDSELIADGDGGWKELPDYLNDLNACHEFEKTLTHEQKAEYLDCLYQFAVRESDGVTDELFLQVHATAAQRAEAFLRTIGKWREEVDKSDDFRSYDNEEGDK